MLLESLSNTRVKREDFASARGVGGINGNLGVCCDFVLVRSGVKGRCSDRRPPQTSANEGAGAPSRASWCLWSRDVLEVHIV